MKLQFLGSKLRALLALGISIAMTACGGGGGSNGGGGSGGGSNGGGGIQTNNPPTISGTPADAVSAGQNYLFIPTASDPDGDKLIFSIENAPVWMTFNTSTGELAGHALSPNIGDYADIVISVSDSKLTATLAPFALSVMPQQLGMQNFETQGQMIVTATGYQSIGTLVMDTGERQQEFENADLNLEFDVDGNLLGLFGETDLPGNISDNVSVPLGIRSAVGLMTGAEINANPDFGIQLRDEISYFVFFIDAGFTLTINKRDGSGSEEIQLDTPAAGQIIIITDPTDPFMYRFGSSPLLGEYGSGQSDNGLIPFKPILDYPGLDTFNGHTIEKGSINIGFWKIFNAFSLSGMRVIKDPQFSDINWQDLGASTVEYRAGMNGTANFGLSVLDVGLFSFADAETSATLDIGLDRQQAALALYVAADVASVNPWIPDWFHFLPTGDMNGQGLLNGNGTFEFELSGSFQSTIPVADVSGVMRIGNDGVTLAATTVNEGQTLEVSLEFAGERTTGRVAFPAAFAESITNDVSAALDREIAAVQQALAELQEATADYEFEASLRGLRQAIPPLMDAGVTLLNSLPATVYKRAYDDALTVMAEKCLTINLGLGTVEYCVDDVVDEVQIARDIAVKARSETRLGIKSGVDAMTNLKAGAQEADDEQLREALRQALDSVYNNRNYSRKVTVTKTFSVWPFAGKTYTLYNETYTRKILSDAEAASIAQARDNVWRIQATSDIMISAQQIFDLLPTDEVINRVRQDVQDGLQQVPIPEGLGYHALGDTYDAFITVDGVDHVTEINVLRPSEVQTGVSDLLAAILLGK